ncbi:PD40 domain-containing protein [Neolewinella lacunae]|uniref:PD40 domain-containing protein n=1 Tax=Neolewinella lacunae TaxID=1517758 RepID=A0A923PKS3_9BACT|nr:PD40 domain-containing protein [Neolewinella lacunae]MBC6995963.1 PD40 domain-containing protein [Neolewinella lacunae]MDN3635193.1 PD40 domain-containing protein [Neolewinella lacunae]
MSRRFLFYLLFSLSFSAFPLFAQLGPVPTLRSEELNDSVAFTGIVADDFGDGSPAVWKEVTNGQASGRWREWYPNGHLRYRAQWSAGLGNGKWEYFYPNGQLRVELVYENDLPTGLSRTYHPNGALAEEAAYLRGKLHGQLSRYDQNGTPTATEYYQNGERVINEPILFLPGLITTPENNEWKITFTPDGNTLYFCRRAAGTVAQKIYTSTKTNGTWGVPSIAPFSTATDEAPFISADGERFYFASFRPIPGRPTTAKIDMNLWVMQKTPGGWSAPTPLPPSINKIMAATTSWPENYETCPTEDSAGNLYYWSKGSNERGTNIFVAPRLPDGTLAPPTELPAPINSPGYDLGAVVSPDGKYLIFASSDRPDTFGGEDLYYARRTPGGWSAPKSLGPVINSGHYESSPAFSPDGKYLYFSSDRGEGRSADGERIWNIYYLETASIPVD